MTESTQIFTVYIRADAPKIWKAITDPEWNQKYGYGAPSHYELKEGGKFFASPSDEMRKHAPFPMPDEMIDGEVLECEEPTRLVQTYRFRFTKEDEAEGFTKLTWEIADTGAGFCRLTVTHEVENAPRMAKAISSNFSFDGGGGWNWILNDLKSLLETGNPLAKQAA